MLPTRIDDFERFRQDLLGLLSRRKEATLELCDALAGCGHKARSVTELSLSGLFQRNYASITRVVGELSLADPGVNIAEKREEMEREFLGLIAPYQPGAFFDKFSVLVSDKTPMPKVYSPTLQDRGFVYSPNAIRGNKPITIGYNLSTIALLEAGPSNWVLPLSMERVPTDKKATEVGVAQLKRLLAQASLGLASRLSVHLGDTDYSAVDFLHPTYEHPNLVLISRLRSNRVLYQRAGAQEQKSRGRPKSYGQPFRLRDPVTWPPAEACACFEITTKKGKCRLVQLQAWDQLLVRGKRNKPMHQIPLRLLRVRMLDPQSQEPVFKRDLWLILSGKRSREFSMEEIYLAYTQRFDIEHFFRFGKQKLLLAALQSPSTQCQENWWTIVMLAYWQLYMARQLAISMPRPWEKYLPNYRSKEGPTGQIPTPASVQRDFERIIRQFPPITFPPIPRGKSKGRQKGDKQIPRKRYAVVKKSKNETNIRPQGP